MKINFSLPLLTLLCIQLVCGINLGEKVSIHGYSSFEFEKTITGKGGDENGSFDADLIDLVLNFKPTDKVRVATDLTWEHGTATEESRGNSAVEYAIVEYAIRSYLKFRVGKMFNPFGIYNEIHTAKPAMLSIKEPFSTNKNNEFGSLIRFYPRWVVGASLLGQFEILEHDADFIFVVSNGDNSITNPFAKDNNRAKALTARFRYNLVESLRLGLSIYNDWITSGDQLFTLGGQLEWELENFALEITGVGGLVGDLNRMGGTAMFSYYLNLYLIPYFRYEYLDPNLEINDDQAMMFVYGLNWQIDEGYFFKFDFNTIRANKGNQDLNGIIYTELKAAVVVGF